MDAEQAAVLRQIDVAELGNRIRSARVARGMTQADLAGDEVSIGYVSRIESGQRRPHGRVLEQIATRLDTSVAELLGGVAPQEYDEIRLLLDYAELSLESGQAAEAAEQASKALARASAGSLGVLADRARYLHARAQEAQGRTDDAVLDLEEVTATATSGLLRIKAGIALSRIHRDSGDFAQAIETGERLLADLDQTPLAHSDESVQLAVTVAAAYYERGDIGQAVRVCRRAVTKAEALDTPTARASAYWNASIMEAKRGSVSDALPLAERALALLGEGQDSRNLARLRSEYGLMQLRQDPPDVEGAERQLLQAAQDFAWSSAAPMDVAQNDLALARTRFLRGDVEASQDLAVRVYSSAADQAPMVAAEAKALEGQTHAARHDTTAALEAYQQAVRLLSGIGADRSAAQLWFELAGLLEDLGANDLARDAYRSAAASTGLRSQAMPVPARGVVGADS